MTNRVRKPTPEMQQAGVKVLRDTYYEGTHYGRIVAIYEAMQKAAPPEYSIREWEKKCNALLAHCSEPECPICAMAMCPSKDALHFHHDGCPSCESKIDLPTATVDIGEGKTTEATLLADAIFITEINKLINS